MKMVAFGIKIHVILQLKTGHLECLRYAHENGCPWGENTCHTAACNGHLDCLRYAHENGCSWDKYTCDDAAENGHLECLRYAHEKWLFLG